MGRGAKIYFDQNLKKNLWKFIKNLRDEIFIYK